MGHLALGFGFLFVGPAQLDRQAHDCAPQHVQSIAYHLDQYVRAAHIDQHLDLAQWLWLDRKLDLAFERKLTPLMLNPWLAPRQHLLRLP